MGTNESASKNASGLTVFFTHVRNDPVSSDLSDYDLVSPPAAINLTKDHFDNGRVQCSQDDTQGYRNVSLSIIFNLEISVGEAPVKLIYPSPDNDFNARYYCSPTDLPSQHYVIESGEVNLSRPTEYTYTATFTMTLTKSGDETVKVHIENGRFDVAGFPA